MNNLTPTWLRGPVPGIQPALQPVAHALQQVAEETPEVISGSLDRLFTYARGESLSDEQLATLAGERTIDSRRPELAEILQLLATTVASALRYLCSVALESLDEPREVGRGRLPSTLRGLLFHAAEHSIRHGGQVITLARVVQGPTS